MAGPGVRGEEEAGGAREGEGAGPGAPQAGGQGVEGGAAACLAPEGCHVGAGEEDGSLGEVAEVEFGWGKWSYGGELVVLRVRISDFRRRARGEEVAGPRREERRGREGGMAGEFGEGGYELVGAKAVAEAVTEGVSEDETTACKSSYLKRARNGVT